MVIVKVSPSTGAVRSMGPWLLTFDFYLLSGLFIKKGYSRNWETLAFRKKQFFMSTKKSGERFYLHFRGWARYEAKLWERGDNLPTCGGHFIVFFHVHLTFRRRATDAEDYSLRRVSEWTCVG